MDDSKINGLREAHSLGQGGIRIAVVMVGCKNGFQGDGALASANVLVAFGRGTHAAFDRGISSASSNNCTGSFGITVEIACLWINCECASRRNNIEKLSNQVTTPCSL